MICHQSGGLDPHRIIQGFYSPSGASYKQPLGPLLRYRGLLGGFSGVGSGFYNLRIGVDRFLSRSLSEVVQALWLNSRDECLPSARMSFGSRGSASLLIGLLWVIQGFIQGLSRGRGVSWSQRPGAVPHPSLHRRSGSRNHLSAFDLPEAGQAKCIFCQRREDHPKNS